MRIGISDFNLSEPAILVDWMQILPASYPETASFTSRVYDGVTNKTWGQANWTPDLPVGTMIRLFQRQGNTANPDDNSWTVFTEIATNGGSVGGTSRYIQYRADLSTSNTLNSPVLKSMAIACSEPVCPPVVFTPLTGTVLTAGTAGTQYTHTISTNPTGYSFTASGLPSTLSIEKSTGMISGKPLGAALYSAIVVSATQGTCVATATYSLTVLPNPLPVTLTRFMVTKEGASAVLNWATTQEINSERFDIERSTDVKNWKNIGSVLAKDESKTLQTYTHSDPAPFKGNVVYSASGNRLSKTIDVKTYRSGMYILELVHHDGQIRTSKIVILK